MRIFRTSHVAACAVVLWMVVSSAATELYYERSDNDSDYQIENENKLEPVAASDQFERAADNQFDLKKSRLLVTLLQYVQHLKDTDNNGPSSKDEDEGVIWSYPFGFKDASVKRWMVALSNNASSKLIPRWKIKKGTSVVCFFKLCSFKQSE